MSGEPVASIWRKRGMIFRPMRIAVAAELRRGGLKPVHDGTTLKRVSQDRFAVPRPQIVTKI